MIHSEQHCEGQAGTTELLPLSLDNLETNLATIYLYFTL